MQVSNPKAIFFWLAIASLGATASAPAWVSVLFIAVAVLLSLLIHIAWALLFSASATLSVYGGLKSKIDTVLGVLFLGAALRLVTSKD